MPDSTAQRTLVKSPPELWAEVSDAESLARRLGEFGEIRITRLEPESTVVWEGDRVSGTVELEPSGWGTRVTLTATPNADAEAQAAEQARVAAAEEEARRVEAARHAAAVARAAEEEKARRAAAEKATAEQGARRAAAEQARRAAEARAAQEARELERVRAEEEARAAEEAAANSGLFARLFGRRRTGVPTATAPRWQLSDEASPPEPPPAAEIPSTAPDEPEPEVPEPPAAPDAPVPEPEPEPEPPTPLPPPAPPVEPEPPAAARAHPPLDGDQVVGVLTGVLDDLGAAHHRPFSRG